MKVKYIFLFVAVFLISSFITYSQENKPKRDSSSFISLHLTPGLDIPLGESADYFKLGGSLGLSGEYAFSNQPMFFISGGMDYNLAPIQAEKSLSILAGGVGGGIYYDLSPRLSLKASVSGGYYYGFFNKSDEVTTSDTTSGGCPFISGGLGVSYLLTPSISLGLGASYKSYLGLFNGVRVLLGTSYYFTGREKRSLKIQSGLPLRPGFLRDAKVPDPGEGIRISEIEFEQVFPVFHKYYDDHPIGAILLHNQETEPITDLTLSLFIKQYMDTPKECLSMEEMGGGETNRIELNALFAERVLDITEGTKVPVEITLEYKMRGEWYRDTRTETIRLYDRNAMNWDDDRKASAFVTAKDPMILSFAKNVAGMVRDKASRVLDNNLLQAIAIHETLSLYGITYVVDPRTPYTELSKNKSKVDFLQFPRQTLDYRAGDCDDLSILYSALLESIGIETAFITVPGHIFIAFSLDMSPREARRTFHSPDELIFKEGKVWIPVEITERDGGFLKAWQIGAREWREHEPGNQAGFCPMHAAWELYEPVGLPGGGSEVDLPATDLIVKTYLQEVIRFIEREMYPRVVKLKAEIKRTGGSPELLNKLGVLYARYGVVDKAEAEFKIIVDRKEFVPALVNLGNIYYLNEDWETALDYYERAYSQEPDNAQVLLPIARVHHKLENYGYARRTYSKLKKSDPDLAERFAYLDLKGEAGVRAAEVSRVEGVVVWTEE